MLRKNISRTVRASVGVTIKGDATDVGAEVALFLGLSDEAMREIGALFFSGESPDLGGVHLQRQNLLNSGRPGRRPY